MIYSVLHAEVLSKGIGEQTTLILTSSCVSVEQVSANSRIFFAVNHEMLK